MSMLKPDYIDLDGDGNKTEPMKEAAKDAKERLDTKIFQLLPKKITPKIFFDL